jgi:hypothetical protein
MEWGESCPWNAVGIDFVAVLSFLGQPLKPKERYIARLDEATMTCEGHSAVIRYKEAGILTTHLKNGPEIAGMSDEAILELFNDAASPSETGCRIQARGGGGAAGFAAD